MLKRSLLATAISLISINASAAIVGGVNFPIKPDPQVFGEQSRQQVCNQYNQQVNIIKHNFAVTGTTSSIPFLESLCSYISLSDGQLEDSGLTFQYNIYDSNNSYAYTLTEKVDLTRNAELIILSQPGETKYLFFTDSDAVLRKQTRTGGLVGSPFVAPANALTATYNPFGVGLTLGVFNRVKTKYLPQMHFVPVMILAVLAIIVLLAHRPILAILL